MNLNENPDRLTEEEQKILSKLISRMDRVVEDLDKKMKQFIAEAKDASISINPDQYLAKLLAQEGIANTEKNRKKVLQARDELYHTRLLLEADDGISIDIEEVKVGLHSCLNNDGEQFVTSWKMPVCRHYILDNVSTEFENIVKGKHGEEYHTKYKLIVKNQVKMRFTHVIKALSMYPNSIAEDVANVIKKTGFLDSNYIDEMLESFNPDEYDPDTMAKIISDEFLEELLERRSTPEFKNIVFSIQKKQGEIIQTPFENNIIVQGCAGSGKSMIMLHRLPILLYDNPTSLDRQRLYIITPSQMYIQLADNMRNQLEITDIKMGTIEQYYDYCISKYPGHKSGEYGRISYARKISAKNEEYVYSEQCVKDIEFLYADLCREPRFTLEKAYSVLNIKNKETKKEKIYEKEITRRLLVLQEIVSVNERVMKKHYSAVKKAVESMTALSATLLHRKERVIRELNIEISRGKREIEKAKIELDNLDPKKNAVAIQNRNNTIQAVENHNNGLRGEIDIIEQDEEYFGALLNNNSKLESVLEPFKNIKEELREKDEQNAYEILDRTGELIGGFYMIAHAISKLDDKYAIYLEPISKSIKRAEKTIVNLQGIQDRYLDYPYFEMIESERKRLNDISTNAIQLAYNYIMLKLGIDTQKKGSIKAIKCSPYLYLQAMYLFKGVPVINSESLLAIDEAQGIAPEELRLLQNINGKKVVFNLYGDIHQHIEGTKGVDSWKDFKSVIDYEKYEMQENYRNASQITEYCNRVFKMKMIAINTTGKGVHELRSKSEFESELVKQLLGDQRSGLSAVLVGDDAEARYLLHTFSQYEKKFHDMTGEDFAIHHTRWNIININDAKGLEFSSVIVLSGRMTKNQKYIAYTRALDDLYVYSDIVDITGFTKRDKEEEKRVSNNEAKQGIKKQTQTKRREDRKNTVAPDYDHSRVRTFFEDMGLEVVDNRADGGRLWIIGEREDIKDIVDEAIDRFSISGKYAANKESKNRNGWFTKTNK